MAQTSTAEELLRAGEPSAALNALQADVRTQAADPRLRVFLFQLLCVLGQWERALNQLQVCADLDAGALAMRETYRDAIRCEMLRVEVFAGRKSPMLFGEPQPWLALMIESLLRSGAGESSAAADLRVQAFEQAPETSGEIDGQAFDWIADADSRLGPVLEGVVNGRYCWVPFARLSQLTIEAPSDLRDFVWLPANLQFANGGEALALIPTRYPGSETAADGMVALARKTVWEEMEPGSYRGFGQRVLTTDRGEFPLLEVRSIRFDSAADAPDNPQV
jgi:type VI secretion system protein ImpE